MIIQIYNEQWSIKKVELKDFKKLKIFAKDDMVYGVCQEMISEIWLNKNLDSQRERATLIHEVAHAIFTITQSSNAELDEEFCVSFISAHLDEINKVVNQYYGKV